MRPDNLKRNIDALKSSSSYVARYLRPITKKAGFEGADPETEFLPAALEMLETPPSPAGRLVAILLCAFFTIAVAWAYFGTVDIIATATGKVIPTGRSKVIQPLEAGLIKAISVQDGQFVKKGTVLVKIDTTISQAEQTRLHDEMIAAELDAARLKAALKMSAQPLKVFVPPVGATPQQILLEQQQLTDQVQDIRSKLADLDGQIMENEGNLTAVQATIDKLKKDIPLIRKRAEMRTYLSDKGYGSELDTLHTEQDLDEHEEELKVERGRLEQASGGVAALKNQRQQAEANFKQKTLNDLSQAEVKAASLEQQFIQATEKNKQQTLIAPVDGTVQQLAIHTVGGVVTPAEELMKIVPKDSKLEVRAMVSNQDIGFVHVGQEAEVKVDTFDFTKYGFIHGKIKSISQDAITEQLPPSSSAGQNKSGAANETSQPPGQELVYAAQVSLNKPWMMVDGRKVYLEPGMAVTVEIKTGKQRVLQYLLSPLDKYKSDALHER